MTTLYCSLRRRDRAVAGNELHTNFNLNADGEYLGLIMPDGVTVSHEYAPQYPEQLNDISFGIGGTTIIGDTLVGDTSLSRVLVPADGSLGSTWTQTGFDDSSWSAGEQAIGFDTDNTGGSTQFALLDFGLNNQRVEAGAVGVSSSGNGVNYPTTAQTSDQGDPFTLAIDNVNAAGSPVGGVDWRDRGNGNSDSLVALGEDHVKNNSGIVRLMLGGLPAGSYDITSYHADASFSQSEDIKIFVTDAAGTAIEQTATGNANFSMGGAGGLTTAEVESTSAAFTIQSDGTSDVVIVFDGTAAADKEVPVDGLLIERVGSLYDAIIDTDLEAAMLNQNASAYQRFEFSVVDAAAYNSLALNMRYDDGFVAYLNGTEIARRNAPAAPLFNSSATAQHPDGQALVPETIDVTAHLGLLATGTNVLAIHGMNLTAADDDFLLIPELLGQNIVVGQNQYFTTPTPGAVNVSGALGLVDALAFSHDRGVLRFAFSALAFHEHAWG